MNSLLSLLHDRTQHELLKYEVHACSSYSADYRPQNILHDTPNDQNSRWQAASSDPAAEHLTLRLLQPAIITSITFGKYHKKHAATTKDFQVHVGLKEANLRLIVSGTMQSPTDAETFLLTGPNDHNVAPAQYVSIRPQSTFESKFGFGLWYIELRGITQADLVQQALAEHQQRTSQTALKYVLKHLRDNGFQAEYDSICAKSHVSLESSHLTSLFQTVVHGKNLGECEHIMQNLKDDFFVDYLKDVPYEAHWTRLDRPNTLMPDQRGGHQMVWDGPSKSLLLFGGWDGQHELGDLWRFDATAGTWTCITEDTSLDGGPCPRSCHKLAIHATKRQLYVLGRFVETNGAVENVVLKNDFYVLNLDTLTWTCLSQDVASDGGPALLFDHQMVVDEQRDMLYVFGGKLITGIVSETSRYSGMYTYDLQQCHWNLVRGDTLDRQPTATPSFKSRIGHSMIHNPRTGLVYLMMGQRGKDFFPDLYAYNAQTDSVVYAQQDVHRVGGPAPGFTHRCCLDTQTNELFFMSGMTRENLSRQDKDASGNESTANHLFVLDLASMSWATIQPDDGPQPSPRFAHQFCYDPDARAFYLFGGNPGNPNDSLDRLGDFWKMTITKTATLQDIRQQCIIDIRIHQYFSFDFL